MHSEAISRQLLLLEKSYCYEENCFSVNPHRKAFHIIDQTITLPDIAHFALVDFVEQLAIKIQLTGR